MSLFDKLWSDKSKPRTASSANEHQALTPNLDDNLNAYKEAFSYPINISFKIRELYVTSLNRNVVILYLDGCADVRAVESKIVEPLLSTSIQPHLEGQTALTLLMQTLTASGGKTISTVQDGIQDLLGGNSMILLEGLSQAISLETAGFEKRAISTPKVENVLKGPKEAFVESGASNRSLIRKHLKDRHLVIEEMTVGEQATAQISIVYLNNIANPDLVAQVKQRIGQIKADSVQELSILEQHIEERPYSLVPSTLMTERPDRTCFFLLEGHIVLLMESPYALIVPVTFWSLFHTAEDQYLRWAYGNYIRIVRLLAVFVALLTPPIFIAVSTFHEEMLQTDLLLAIAATRERVPFPVVIEVLIMEIAFELLREAGVRIPTVIGPTIGIVGALILGQAAVDANIVSPILVIIVAITGLSSFAIPEISFNFGVRILRFVILIISAIMGFFGISLFLTGLLAYLVSLKSFGVPFLSPLSPYARSSNDMLIRDPIWKQWLLPSNLSGLKKARAKKPEGNSRQ